jgi:hypothetical protein
MFLIWFLVVHPTGPKGGDISPRFYWTWVAGGVTAVAGFLAGPERMMDGFGRVWVAIGWVLFRDNRR